MKQEGVQYLDLWYMQLLGGRLSIEIKYRKSIIFQVIVVTIYAEVIDSKKIKENVREKLYASIK